MTMNQIASKSAPDESWTDKPYKGVPVVVRKLKRRMHLLRRYKRLRRVEGVYSDGLDTLVKLILERIRADQQTIIHIGGATGSGKSSLGLNLAWKLSRALKQKWNLATDYILTASDLSYRIHYGRDTGVLLMDEAYTTLASVRGMTRESNDIVSLFTVMRSKHFTTIMCSPTIERISPNVRQNFVDFRIECSSPQGSWVPGYGRGLFQVYVPTTATFSKNAEPWWELILTGVFRDYPPELREPYLKAKAMHQDRVTTQNIERINEADSSNEAYYRKLYASEMRAEGKSEDAIQATLANSILAGDAASKKQVAVNFTALNPAAYVDPKYTDDTPLVKRIRKPKDLVVPDLKSGADMKPLPEPEPEPGERPKNKGGRPKGRKDSYKRIRRRPEEIHGEQK